MTAPSGSARLQGVASWRDGRLTWFHELEDMFVTSMLEDRNGTVWVGGMIATAVICVPCETDAARVPEERPAGMFGRFVWSLHEDDSRHSLGGRGFRLWRWAPGAPDVIRLRDCRSAT